MTTERKPTTNFTAVSCSDWFGLKPPLVLYVLFTNTNTFKPQFEFAQFLTTHGFFNDSRYWLVIDITLEAPNDQAQLPPM